MSEGRPEVKPWRETEDADRAAELVRLVADIAPRPLDVGKGWDGVIERVARPRSSRLLWFAAATAAVLLAFFSLQMQTPARTQALAPVAPVAVKAPACEEPLMSIEGSRPPAVAQQEAPAPKAPAPSKSRVVVAAPGPTPAPVEAEPEVAPENPADVLLASGAIWSAPSEDALRIERGLVEVLPHDQPYTVTTPELSVTATHARYAADVTESGTVVRIFEGDADVFVRGQQLTMHAGDVRSFSAGQLPSALDVVPPEVSLPACARRSYEQRVACLVTEGRHDGLRAQAALYEAAYLQARSGRPAGAELTLRESLRRFPGGVLHPEIRIALLKSLYAQSRLGEAADVGRNFLQECPDDPRKTDVEAFVRTVEWLESR